MEELLLLEKQGNEQRRLELLQEEQRQLQAKRKNKQALLDELVRSTRCTSVRSGGDKSSRTVTDVPNLAHKHTHSHTFSLRVHGCGSLRDYYQSLC